MTFVVFVGAAILLSAGYTYAMAVPRCIRISGWPIHRVRSGGAENCDLHFLA